MNGDSVKRLLDILVATTGLIFLAPVFLAVAVLVRFSMGAPVIFKQVRPGHLGRPFHIYKFRTMKNVKDQSGKDLPDDERVTTVGIALRRTSLDELPELWNVLKGEMTLVGPRPLLMEHLPLFNKEQARRLETKPGITGWAQINGRHSIPFSKRIALDVWYVDHRSFWLDLRILLMTIPKAISSADVESTEQEDVVIDIGRDRQ